MLEAYLLFVDLHLAEIATKCAEVFNVVGLEIYNFLFLHFSGGFFSFQVCWFSWRWLFFNTSFKQAPCGDGGDDNDVWTSCGQSAHGVGQGGQAPWEENLVLTWYICKTPDIQIIF